MMGKREDMAHTDPIIAAALSSRKEHHGRSEVFGWLWARYDVYGEQLSHRGVNWETMAKGLQDDGIVDGRGGPPTAKTVRATFYKVKQIRTGRKPKRRPVKAKPEIKRTFGRSAA